MSSIPCRQNTIKNSKPKFYTIDYFVRFAYTQTIKKVIVRCVIGNYFRYLIVKFTILRNRPSAVPHSVKTDLYQFFSAIFSKIKIIPTLDNSNEIWSFIFPQPHSFTLFFELHLRALCPKD